MRSRVTRTPIIWLFNKSNRQIVYKSITQRTDKPFALLLAVTESIPVIVEHIPEPGSASIEYGRWSGIIEYYIPHINFYV